MFYSISEANQPNSLIDGVVLKQLESHQDNRGYFREIIRATDDHFGEGFGQWSHSRMERRTVKAWHYHYQQTDWWYVPVGVIEVVLFDDRRGSLTFQRKMHFKLGETKRDPQAFTALVRIPPGVLHGCKVITHEAHLFYITSHMYNPQDEGRHPFNSSRVPHDWGNPEQLIVSENDTKTIIPGVGVQNESDYDYH